MGMIGTMILHDALDEETATLVRWVRNDMPAPIEVLDVSGKAGEDQSGDPAIFLTLTLPDTPGDETWDSAKTRKLRRIIHDEVRRAGIPAYVYISLQPKTLVAGE
jgi:hypothetical protein